MVNLTDGCYALARDGTSYGPITGPVPAYCKCAKCQDAGLYVAGTKRWLPNGRVWGWRKDPNDIVEVHPAFFN